MLKSIGGIAMFFFCVLNTLKSSKKDYPIQQDILPIKMNIHII